MKKKEILKMISQKYKDDIKKAIKILKKADVKEIYLFGSIAKNEESENSDIDIAVVGLKPENYFKVYGKLMMALVHDFDLIKLDDKKSRFAKYIKENEELVKIA